MGGGGYTSCSKAPARPPAGAPAPPPLARRARLARLFRGATAALVAEAGPTLKPFECQNPLNVGSRPKKAHRGAAGRAQCHVSDRDHLARLSHLQVALRLPAPLPSPTAFERVGSPRGVWGGCQHTHFAFCRTRTRCSSASRASTRRSTASSTRESCPGAKASPRRARLLRPTPRPPRRAVPTASSRAAARAARALSAGRRRRPS